MIRDEIGRNPVTLKIAGSLSMIDPDGEIFVDLEVEVRRIHPVIVSYIPYLLPLLHLLLLTHFDFVEVGVERVCESQLPILDPGMADHDDISPADMDVAREDNNAVSNRIDGEAEPLGTPTIRHPILAKMSIRAEATGFDEPGSIGRSHRKIKAI